MLEPAVYTESEDEEEIVRLGAAIFEELSTDLREVSQCP